MELRHLRYFVAVAEELNFRKASERLHVSAPALSRQIKDLETALGVQLLERNTGGTQLTQGGMIFLAEARLTLSQFQRAVVVARETAKGQRGHLTVAYVEPVLMGFMPESMTAFRKRHPNVDISLVELPLGEQIAALRAGTIQIGFTTTGNSDLPLGMDSAEIVRSPIRAVVGRRHRLAGLSRVTLADLAREWLLCLRLKKETASVHGEIMQRLFSARGLDVRPIRPIEGTEAFRAYLESGLGISLIPKIGGISRSRNLCFKSLEDASSDLFVGLHAVWRAGPNSQTATDFIGTMRQVARKKSLSKSG
jgi:DNA-binding transcriptional LysR family regulator